ncbi:hypothetical protein [Methylopila sp. 73B]|uniref:hypothetical protein n=1 Tax=Methylopila sp. 73B TaxID=1120792 RepID=UPI0003AB2B6A|nr:hypothetical protein [Methylopila sp. 73B]
MDTVRTSVSYDLAAWVENLVLIGEQSIDARGNELSNRLTGNAAANVLDGAAGADTLIGGSGDDVYIIDDRGDLSKEVAGGGVDTVEASLSWSLGAHLENLILTGNAALNGYGNALSNQIVGNAGSNVLDGKPAPTL